MFALLSCFANPGVSLMQFSQDIYMQCEYAARPPYTLGCILVGTSVQQDLRSSRAHSNKISPAAETERGSCYFFNSFSFFGWNICMCFGHANFCLFALSHHERMQMWIIGRSYVCMVRVALNVWSGGFCVGNSIWFFLIWVYFFIFILYNKIRFVYTSILLMSVISNIS